MPDWFRRAYFSFHSQVRLRFKLAAGLGEPWCRDGGIPQGCPLSMMFIVALYVPWCRHLEVVPDVKPQLYADNLKCSAERPGALFDATRFTSRLRFKLAAGLGEPWCRGGGIPQGCPLSMVSLLPCMSLGVVILGLCQMSTAALRR